jgi:uncharacterized protein (DUF2141 family)
MAITQYQVGLASTAAAIIISKRADEEVVMAVAIDIAGARNYVATIVTDIYSPI